MKASFAGVFVVLLLGLGSSGHAAEFACAGGNVACLLSAIRSANGLGEPSTIRLAEGTYTLAAVDNDTDGPNGLPSVTKIVTIHGSGAQSTIIERAADAPEFRLMHVAQTGALALEDVTLRGGIAGGNFPITSLRVRGGGILNDRGRVTLSHARLAGHRVVGSGVAFGGGLFNNDGTVILSSSTLAENAAEARPFAPVHGAALATHGGSVTITNSTIVGNRIGEVGTQSVSNETGAVSDARHPSVTEGPGAVVRIVNSTIGRNVGGGIYALRGQWTIVDSTIAYNENLHSAGGIFAEGGGVTLRNTMIAQNSTRDCGGSMTSLDHNLIGTTRECTIALQPHDQTGTPGLAIYSDDGTPGRGHWPLLPTSPAIDAGDTATCPPLDQLGRSRLGPCDIGAIEFDPEPDPPAAFVTGFYRYALGREPDPAEVAGWVSFLRGADPTPARARVMTHAFFDGPEYRARQPMTPEPHVTALYRAILGRDPELVGLNGWALMLLTRLNDLPGLFVGSPEFHQVLPDCDDQAGLRALLTRLYEKGLGRSPGANEMAQWLFNFSVRCDIAGTVQAILNSQEYRSFSRTLAEHVVILYRALLAREARADEVDSWVEYLAAPFIEDQFIESPEFAARWQQLVSSASQPASMAGGGGEDMR